MRVPDFDTLFQAAIRLIPLAEVMTALAPAIEPDVIGATVTAGGQTFVISHVQHATERLIHTMLSQPGAGADKRFDLFREAAVQVRQARSYTLMYEYQKAELARLAEQPALLSQAWANLNNAVVVNGESPQTREWRVLLDFPIADIEDVVLTHSDHAHELRKFSPARGLISEDERFAISERVRAGLRERNAQQDRCD
ncbi:hypothetical protein [Pseudomonas sp. dw_358]|uniref:hypothetical protein n=1 Tax=Pseudomonas sp. dw_358 TaxID=2720083 RepID=UPI001BD61844|nr:hypothetical protein [Pseudomonas sp. dw_358]